MKFPSPAELTIMRTLKRRRAGMYGLQIAAASEGIHREGVYVQLQRLVAKQWLDVTAGPPRRLYALTPRGAKLLALVDAADGRNSITHRENAT